MGPRGLKTTLKATIPIDCNKGIRNVSLKEYRGQTIAVDFTNLLYKYVQRSAHKNGFILEFINLIHKFKKYDINLIFVFDGKPCEEKMDRINSRRAHRDESYEQLKDIMTIDIEKIENNEEKDIIQKKIESLKVRSSKVYYNNFSLCKKLFDLLNVKYVHLESGESDSVFKYLMDKNFVDACFSQDMDLLIYGCKKVLQELDYINDNIIEYDYDKILESLDLTREQFVDMCILSGTDYNSKITNSNISNNIDLIKQYKTIENVITNIDIINKPRPEGKKIVVPSVFNVDFVRQLYNIIIIDTDYEKTILANVTKKSITKKIDIDQLSNEVRKLMAFISTMNNSTKYLFKLKEYIYSTYKVNVSF